LIFWLEISKIILKRFCRDWRNQQCRFRASTTEPRNGRGQRL